MMGRSNGKGPPLWFISFLIAILYSLFLVLLDIQLSPASASWVPATLSEMGERDPADFQSVFGDSSTSLPGIESREAEGLALSSAIELPEEEEETQEQEPAVGGQDVSEPSIADEPIEDEAQEQEPAVGGQDVSEPSIDNKPIEDEAQEQEPAVGGQDVSESQYRTMGEEVQGMVFESAVGGQDFLEPFTADESIEDDTQEQEPAVGGQDVSVASSTDLSPVLERLDALQSLYLYSLASLWALGGLFFAFKLGGALI